MTQGVYHNASQSIEVACDLTLTDNKIYIYLQNQNKDLIIWDLNSVDAHFLGGLLKLTRKTDSDLSLQCSGEIARLIYNAWKVPVPVEKHKRKTSKRVYTFFITIVLVFVMICVLAYVYLLPWLAEKAVSLIPVSVEKSMGDQLSKVYGEEAKTNDSANYYANQFIHQLKVASPYSLQVTVLDSPEINAFAVPGGHIFVYTGLLNKMKSHEELAALLGHEITHVTERHSLKSMLRGATASIVISAFVGDVSDLLPWLLSKADDFKQLDYSRDLETEADDKGLELMVKNKIDPKGMIRLLELLKTEAAEMPSMMKYLSSHPETQDRIDHAKENSKMELEFPESPRLKSSFERLKTHL